MSDLQLALIVIGAVLVAAVYAYNKWQEARYRRQADAGLSPSQTDVLFRSTADPRPAGSPRVEPTLAVDAAPPDLTVPQQRGDSQQPSKGELFEQLDLIVDIQAPAPTP